MYNCPKHPGYSGLVKPQVACERCWGMYFARIPPPCGSSQDHPVAKYLKEDHPLTDKDEVVFLGNCKPYCTCVRCQIGG